MTIPPALCPACNETSLLIPYGNSFPVSLNSNAECNRTACGWTGTLRDVLPEPISIRNDHIEAIKRAFEEEIVNTISDQIVGKQRPTSSILAVVKDQARRLGYDCDPYVSPSDPRAIILGNLTLTATSTISTT